jgi:uncharacterized protein YbcV (DUF1398 family)
MLSEILVISIMNNNKAIQETLENHQSNVYKKLQNVRIKGKRLPEYFGDIYKQHKEGKISFADFLKESWDEYQRNKDIIESGIK